MNVRADRKFLYTNRDFRPFRPVRLQFLASFRTRWRHFSLPGHSLGKHTAGRTTAISRPLTSYSKCRVWPSWFVSETFWPVSCLIVRYQDALYGVIIAQYFTRFVRICQVFRPPSFVQNPGPKLTVFGQVKWSEQAHRIFGAR